MTISPAWTDAERLAVIRVIAQQLSERARQQKSDSTDTYHTATTILFVAGMPAAFLEANRANMLREADTAAAERGA